MIIVIINVNIHMFVQKNNLWVYERNDIEIVFYANPFDSKNLLKSFMKIIKLELNDDPFIVDPKIIKYLEKYCFCHFNKIFPELLQNEILEFIMKIAPSRKSYVSNNITGIKLCVFDKKFIEDRKLLLEMHDNLFSEMDNSWLDNHIKKYCKYYKNVPYSYLSCVEYDKIYNSYDPKKKLYSKTIMNREMEIMLKCYQY